MSHAVIVSESSIQLKGDSPATSEVESTVEQLVSDRTDIDSIPANTHVGYSKSLETGEVVISLFSEFEHGQ